MSQHPIPIDKDLILHFLKCIWEGKPIDPPKAPNAALPLLSLSEFKALPPNEMLAAVRGDGAAVPAAIEAPGLFHLPDGKRWDIYSVLALAGVCYHVAAIASSKSEWEARPLELVEHHQTQWDQELNSALRFFRVQARRIDLAANKDERAQRLLAMEVPDAGLREWYVHGSGVRTVA